MSLFYNILHITLIRKVVQNLILHIILVHLTIYFKVMDQEYLNRPDREPIFFSLKYKFKLYSINFLTNDPNNLLMFPTWINQHFLFLKLKDYVKTYGPSINHWNQYILINIMCQYKKKTWIQLLTISLS